MTSIDLWEVITTDPEGQRPFGQTFHDNAAAAAYARTMRRAGFGAELSPVFATQPDLKAALTSAATYYEDAALTAAVRAYKQATTK